MDDTDGSQLRESYFERFPGVWHHGDYLKITKHSSCVIYGRSDATINRGGVRIGTSEIYRVIDQIQEIVDSLIVEIPDGKSGSIVPLFVVLQGGCQLTADLQREIKHRIRSQCSPRHVPTDIHVVTELPHTLNGKKLEIPVKKILMGQPIEKVVNIDSITNPESLDYFVQFSKKI